MCSYHPAENESKHKILRLILRKSLFNQYDLLYWMKTIKNSMCITCMKNRMRDMFGIFLENMHAFCKGVHIIIEDSSNPEP